MDITILHRNNLIALDQQEQALAWLIENGPLVNDPPIPMAQLRNLVKARRLVRLRRNLYLAPTAQGVLPSLPRTISLVDPNGYISGHGALSLHNLNDQDIVTWYSVSAHRHADIIYGSFSAHFVLSPIRRSAAMTTGILVRGERIIVATPARALIDEIELMPFGLDYSETARILRFALDTAATSEDSIIAEMGGTPTVAAARRLGFLLEIATGRKNLRLLAMAQSVSGMTRVAGSDIPEYAWRLYLPQLRDTILGASR